MKMYKAALVLFTGILTLTVHNFGQTRAESVNDYHRTAFDVGENRIIVERNLAKSETLVIAYSVATGRVVPLDENDRRQMSSKYRPNQLQEKDIEALSLIAEWPTGTPVFGYFTNYHVIVPGGECKFVYRVSQKEQWDNSKILELLSDHSSYRSYSPNDPIRNTFKVQQNDDLSTITFYLNQKEIVFENDHRKASTAIFAFVRNTGEISVLTDEDRSDLMQIIDTNKQGRAEILGSALNLLQDWPISMPVMAITDEIKSIGIPSGCFAEYRDRSDERDDYKWFDTWQSRPEAYSSLCSSIRRTVSGRIL